MTSICSVGPCIVFPLFINIPIFSSLPTWMCRGGFPNEYHTIQAIGRDQNYKSVLIANLFIFYRIIFYFNLFSFHFFASKFLLAQPFKKERPHTSFFFCKNPILCKRLVQVNAYNFLLKWIFFFLLLIMTYYSSITTKWIRKRRKKSKMK